MLRMRPGRSSPRRVRVTGAPSSSPPPREGLPSAVSVLSLTGFLVSSYGSLAVLLIVLAGRGDRSRTCDIRFWRPALWPTELHPSGGRARPCRPVRGRAGAEASCPQSDECTGSRRRDKPVAFPEPGGPPRPVVGTMGA